MAAMRIAVAVFKNCLQGRLRAVPRLSYQGMTIHGALMVSGLDPVLHASQRSFGRASRSTSQRTALQTHRLV